MTEELIRMVDRLRSGVERWQCERCKMWFEIDYLNDDYVCEFCETEEEKKKWE